MQDASAKGEKVLKEADRVSVTPRIPKGPKHEKNISKVPVDFFFPFLTIQSQ